MTATWPEGVIARYLTVGGATVDITPTAHPYKADDGIVGTRNATRTTCTGCDTSKDFSHWRIHQGTWSSWDVEDPDGAGQQAREWSQAHAEKCRAMLNPDTTQTRT